MTAHSEIDFDWLQANGFPSFDEFKKNPDKYRGHPEELLSSVDMSIQDMSARRVLKRQRYMWRDQYECDSLEKLQSIAAQEGYKMSDCEMQPLQMKLHGTSSGGAAEILIRFWPKAEFRAMGGIIANG